MSLSSDHHSSRFPARLDRPLSSLPDAELRSLSKRLGRSVRVVERRFLATLPEIARRGLFAPRFPSIHAYARRVGGRSREAVDRVLALDRRLAPFPAVHRLLESGEVGWSLLARVPVKELEADAEGWARLLRTCSKAEIDTMLRARRGEGEGGGAEQRADVAGASRPATPAPGIATASGAAAGALPGGSGAGSVLAASGAARTLRSGCRREPGGDLSPGADGGGLAAGPGGLDLRVTLDPVREARLRTLVRERERELGRPLSLTAFFLELLDEAWAEPGIDGVREPDAATLEAMRARAVESATRSRGKEAPPRVVRYVRVRALGRCEAAGCTRPGDHLHHEAGRRVPVPHHPDRTWLLCIAHHGLRHLGRIANPEDPPPGWRVSPAGAASRSRGNDLGYQVRRHAARRRDSWPGSTELVEPAVLALPNGRPGTDVQPAP